MNSSDKNQNIKLIQPIKKVKHWRDMMDPDNWAIVERLEADKVFPKGYYRVCPCCHYPDKLTDTEAEELEKSIERTKSGLIIPKQDLS